MAKISDFIIAMIIASLVIIVITLSTAQLSSNYNVTFDNASAQQYNKLQELTNLSNDIKTKTTTFQVTSGAPDIIGTLFTSGYNVLLISVKSIDLFIGVIDSGFNNIGLGELGIYFKVAIVSIIIIIIFLGIIVSSVVKREV